MTDEIELIEEVEEIKKENKKSKWTYEKALAFMTRNGHKTSERQVHLSDKAGIGALGCADYLRRQHKFEVFYPER